MPLDFVRYTPEIKTVDPNLDRLLEQIIASSTRGSGTYTAGLSSMSTRLSCAGSEPWLVIEV